MPRREPNYIALGCAIAHVICFLFLPFYSIIVIHINGFALMQFYPILILPLVAGILMGLSSTLMGIRLSMGIGASSFVVGLILLLTGQEILKNGNALTSLIGTIATQALGFDITSGIPLVSIGVGGILTLLLSAGFVVTEAVMASKKAPPTPRPNDQDW